MTDAPRIEVQRAYVRPLPEPGGTRILVDRVWPRGIRKEDLRLDLWLKELAPSERLRKWFGHRPERWPEFDRRYRTELAEPDRAALLAQVRRLTQQGPVLLIYGANDEEHNQAVVLCDVLLGRPPVIPARAAKRGGPAAS